MELLISMRRDFVGGREYMQAARAKTFLMSFSFASGFRQPLQKYSELLGIVFGCYLEDHGT